MSAPLSVVSGKCRQVNDERELLLHVIDEPIVGRDELATFLLRESDVDAIVDAHPQRGGDGVGTGSNGR